MNRIRGHVVYGKLSQVWVQTEVHVRVRVEREWSDAEIGFLRSKYLTMSNTEMGVQLRRSRQSVGNMLARLNLRRP